MQQFAKTCGGVYLIAITLLITIALIITLILIKNPVLAVIGFAAMFACIVLGLASIRDIEYKPFFTQNKHK